MKIIVAYFENLADVCGGLEKSICRFSNAFVERGHDVSIVTYDEHTGKPFFELNDRVALFNLRQDHRMTGLEKGIREIYRLFGRRAVRYWKANHQHKKLASNFRALTERLYPDIIIAYGTMSAGEVGRSGVAVPWMTCFRNDPNVLCRNLLPYERAAVERSAAIQVLLPSFRNELVKYIKNDQVVFIPNAVKIDVPQAQLETSKETFRIIDVARLNKKQKRQELLIQAFAALSDKFPQWNVELWGADTSHYQRELEALVAKKHLEGRVLFRGLTHDMAAVYAQADVFAFPSRYEGFPNALADAMAAGLPVVGFASCPSVRDMISDGKDGLLSADGADELRGVLERLMCDPKLRKDLGAEARLTMRRYSEDKVWDQWETVLSEIIESNNGRKVND